MPSGSYFFLVGGRAVPEGGQARFGGGVSAVAVVVAVVSGAAVALAAGAAVAVAVAAGSGVAVVASGALVVAVAVAEGGASVGSGEAVALAEAVELSGCGRRRGAARSDRRGCRRALRAFVASWREPPKRGGHQEKRKRKKDEHAPAMRSPRHGK